MSAPTPPPHLEPGLRSELVELLAQALVARRRRLRNPAPTQTGGSVTVGPPRSPERCSPDHGELRLVLLDRADLDRLIENSKETGALPDAT